MSDHQTQDFPIRFFGGATTVFQYGGLRFVTDPTFDGPGNFDVPGGLVLVKTAPAHGTPADIGPLDVALLSHEHPDHLDDSGRELLADVPLVLTTADGGQGLGQGVKGLADFESVSLDRPDGGSVTVTAVPAIHGPASREDIEPVLGTVIGFVLTGDGLPTVYISGDNASLDEVKKIAERFAPVDTAILYAGAPRFPVLFDNQCIVLDSAQAAEAARILDAGRVLPVHYDGWTHLTEGRDDLESAFASAGLADRLHWGITG
ncbi:MBL fold metallo-hydrolase [Streptomyces nigra]|uniref:MBL fold metallo-hydrolase n=1 Tax=Streptomyces nigra TaxID=1827580 RepID=UPI0036EBA0AC